MGNYILNFVCVLLRLWFVYCESKNSFILLILTGKSPDAKISSVKVSNHTIAAPVIFLSSILAKTKGELCTTSRFGKNG